MAMTAAVTAGRRRRHAAPAPVYPIAGIGGRHAIEALAFEPGVETVDSPRHAELLVLAGAFPEDVHGAIRSIHDQLPHPRVCVFLAPTRDSKPPAFADAMSIVTVAADEDPGAALQHLHRELLQSGRRTSADLLPDEPPAPWRGRGDHGQGGEGMMGGKPYGRPMAMTDDDIRDGLSLDAARVTIGPFAPMLPSGLRLELTMQGDVIQDVEILSPPYAEDAVLGPWRRALDEGASIRELERLRAAHHLRCIARLLDVRGSKMIALRALRLAHDVEARRVQRLRPLDVKWLSWACRFPLDAGLGVLDANAARRLMGPALRACGADRDLRRRHEAYRRLHFRPVVQPVVKWAGDVRSRLAQWLAEARQSLELAAAKGAGRPVTFPAGIEAPTGPLGVDRAPQRFTREVEQLLHGLTWPQAVTVLSSFDGDSLHRMLEAVR